MGHEFSGVVAEVGSDVRDVKVGDGGPRARRLRRYVLVEVAERSCIRDAPEHVGFEEAATFEPFGTSLRGVGLYAPKAGETVVILGPGSSASAPSRRSARRPRRAGDRRRQRAERLEMARQVGADEVIDFKQGRGAGLRSIGEQEVRASGIAAATSTRSSTARGRSTRRSKASRCSSRRTAGVGGPLRV